MSRVRLLMVGLVLSLTVVFTAGSALAAPSAAVNLGDDKTYGVGDKPYSIASADFDDDGVADLVVPNQLSNTVSVLLGRGGGAFETPVGYPTGLAPRTVATADLDGDGDVDLAVANKDSNDVSILLGRGDGTFAPGGRFASGGGGPRTVIAADFDGDGDADLAVANRFSDAVAVLRNNGDATFGPPTNFGAGLYPFNLTASDADRDGHLDLAVANHPYEGNNTYAGNFSILRGNGDGSFGAPAGYGVGLGPVAVVAGNFNGDAKPDFALANRESDGVTVLAQGTTSLGLTAGRTLMTYPERTGLSGVLRDALGNPLGGEKVVLEWRPWAGDPAKLPFQPVEGQPAGGLTTAPDGTFSLPGVQPRWTTDYRVRFAGDAANDPVTSTVEVVNLKVKVDLAVSGADLKLGGSRAISGTVFPAHHDLPITLVIERNGAPVATKRAPVNEVSRFATSYKPTRTGTYTVTARFPNHFPGHLGNTSVTRRFQVIP